MNSYTDTPTPMYTDWHHLAIYTAASWDANSACFLPGKSHSIPRPIPSPRKLNPGGSPRRKLARKPHLSHLLNFSREWVERIHTVFTFYWDHLQLQKRKHCEIRITLRPICPGFLFIWWQWETRWERLAKSREPSNRANLLRPKGMSFLEDVSPKFICLGCDKIVFQKEKLLQEWELTTVQCAAGCVKPLWHSLESSIMSW